MHKSPCCGARVSIALRGNFLYTQMRATCKECGASGAWSPHMALAVSTIPLPPPAPPAMPDSEGHG